MASFFAAPTLLLDRLIVLENEQVLLSFALRALSSFLPFLIVRKTVPEHAAFALTPAGTLILPLTTIFTLPPLIVAVAPLPLPESENVGSGRASSGVVVIAAFTLTTFVASLTLPARSR